MADTTQWDLVVIGGGPAGYVGAIRAAQLGMKVACVERDQLGGTCLNWGCIPTKSLLAAAEFYVRLRQDAAQWGILADNVRHDWAKVIARSRAVAATLNRGIGGLLRKHGIAHVSGQGRIAAPGRVEVQGADGAPAQALAARHVLIATGARPRALPGLPFDGAKVLSYREAMVLAQQPRRLAIVGAGPIGMEFAYFFRAFGTEVVLVEMLEHLLPNEDEEVSAVLEKAWRRLGIQTHLGSRVVSADTSGQGVALTVAPVHDGAQAQRVEAENVLVAVGVEGRVDGLCEADLGLAVERGRIVVDRSTYRTSVAGVYAVGDVIGPPWLAHVASEEAVVCVERIAGQQPVPIDYEAIPACTYCHPQVASLGLTERACRERGLRYRVGKFPLQASGKAQALGSTQGFVKLIADAEHGEILGAHLVGENVTELVAEIGLARRIEATAADLIATLHAHPTLSEAVREASLGVAGRMIHF